MTTIDRARLDLFELLMTINDLETLKSFKLNLLRTRDGGTEKSPEQRLKEKIETLRLTPRQQARYGALRQKQVEKKWSEEERSEFLELLRQDELLQIERAKMIGELAQLKQVPFQTLMVRYAPEKIDFC